MSNNFSGPSKFGDVAPSRFPGERLGLPETGSASVGRIGRRVAAIFIDWALAVALTMLFSGRDYFSLTSSQGSQFIILAVFVALQIVSMVIIGGSIGQRLCGLHLVTLRGKHPGLWRPIVRSVLLALVLPAIVWDSDQRGFHDKVAGTILVRA